MTRVLPALLTSFDPVNSFRETEETPFCPVQEKTPYHHLLFYILTIIVNISSLDFLSLFFLLIINKLYVTATGIESAKNAVVFLMRWH